MNPWPKKLLIDLDAGWVEFTQNDQPERLPFTHPRAFDAIAAAYLRAGWDAKYVYSFTWMGRPIIQLPDDAFRLQELIYAVKPDVIIETGVAHGGSLIFYAGLCKAMGIGRVIGIDIEIRSHNRQAIEAHELFDPITLIEGSSIRPEIVTQVSQLLKPEDKTIVFLDSNHSRDHVLSELIAYSAMVSKGSYIVAMDGIMRHVAGAPRSSLDWTDNNPCTAVQLFLETHNNFALVEPPIPFNEGAVTSRVSYCPDAFLQRIA